MRFMMSAVFSVVVIVEEVTVPLLTVLTVDVCLSVSWTEPLLKTTCCPHRSRHIRLKIRQEMA
jgi:hypothetical protein